MKRGSTDSTNEKSKREMSFHLFGFKPYIAADVFGDSSKSYGTIVVVSDQASVISFVHYLARVRHPAKIFIHSSCSEILDSEDFRKSEEVNNSIVEEIERNRGVKIARAVDPDESAVKENTDGEEVGQSSETEIIVFEKLTEDIRRELLAQEHLTFLADEEIPLEVLKAYQGITLQAVYVCREEGSDEAFSIMENFHESAVSVCVQTHVQRWWKGMIRPDTETLRWKKTDGELLLSVILPVYNVSKYLDKCLEGLLAWKSPFVEFIFVDDGSPDDSAEVIKRYMQDDSRIRLIRKENGGCASARNAGLHEARGKYVAFFDPDDFCNQTMFPKLLSRAMQGDYDLAYCGYDEYFDELGESRPVKNEILKEPYTTGVTARFGIDMLTINTRVAIWRYIVKKEVLERAGITFMESIRRFDDLPFRIEMIFAARSVVCVPEHLYFYRLGRPGQDVSCHDERLGVHFPIFRHLDARILPMKMQHRIDMLQIVKIHTHGYALQMLEPKYRRKYRKMARRDLWKNCSKGRTLLLMLRYSGLKNMKWMYF